VTQHTVDLLIVGAGPVGLYGAYYAGVRGLCTAVIDSLPEHGGQITAMYPDKQIFDIAGYPAVKGRDLVHALTQQAATADPVYLLGQEARELTTDGRSHRHHEHWRRDPLPRHCDHRGHRNIHAPQAASRRGVPRQGAGVLRSRPGPLHRRRRCHRRWGDSALDWAVMLDEIAASVTVVHRRKAFRAHAATVGQVKRSAVDLITDAELTALGGIGAVAHADIAIRGSDDIRRLPYQKVVAALGFIANLGPLRAWGIELRDNRHIIVDSAMRTRRPGVFAAGDIVDYDGKVRLITVGFGEVATAVNNAAVHVDPNAQLFPGHSTDKQPAPTPA
jgi:ferredoxin/flavodoxin---NADP+ reductase